MITKIKMKKNYILYLMLLFPFLEMPRFGIIPSINSFFYVLKIVSAIIVLILCFLKKDISKTGVFLCFFGLAFIVSTYINNGNVLGAISQGLALIIPYLLIQYAIKRFPIKYVFRPIIVTFFAYALITSIQLINTPFEIWHGQGLRVGSSILYDDFGSILALGDAKRLIFMLLPVICFESLIVCKKHTISFWFIILLMITWFDIVYTWSVSAIFVLTIYTILLAGRYSMFLKKIIYKINIWYIYSFAILLNITLVFCNILDYMGGFLNLFGKAITLSGRTFVWDKALDYIYKSPIWGYGLNDQLTMERFWGLVHMHNHFLDLLYKGGMVYFFLYFLILIKVGKNLDKLTDCNEKYIMLISVFALLILGLTDSITHNILFLIYALVDSMKKIVESNEAKNYYIGGSK